MNTALFPDLVVNGETVPRALIAAEAQNHSAPKGKPGLAWRKAANALAVRTLLLQEAARCGIDARPRDFGQGRSETGDEALIRALLDAAIEVPAPTEGEVYEEWARDPDRFRAPPLWEVSHLLCACDPRNRAASDAARARADELARRALADPDQFGALAARESDCGSKTANGSLGQLGPGDTVPEFEAVLRTLSAGDITEAPVLTRHGWHVIRMDAVAEGAVLPFKTVGKAIAQAIEKARWTRAARALTDDLVARADISGADLGPVGEVAA